MSMREFNDAITNYGGDINDIISILDDSVRASKGMESRRMPVGRASELMLREISETEMLRNKREKLISEARRNPGMLSATDGFGYRGQHTAPTADDGASMSDLTLNGIFPSNIYDEGQLKLYGSGYPNLDAKARKTITAAKGDPDFRITIYRAVPKDAGDDINPGDWVTPVREYADIHGQSNLGDDFKVVSTEVRAGDLFTEGNSILESGYSPRGRDGMSSTTTLDRPKLSTRPPISWAPDAEIPKRPTLTWTKELADAVKDIRGAVKVTDDKTVLDASTLAGDAGELFAQQCFVDLPEGHNVLIANIPAVNNLDPMPYVVATKINGAVIVREISKEAFDSLRRNRNNPDGRHNGSLHVPNKDTEELFDNFAEFSKDVGTLAELSNRYGMPTPRIILTQQPNKEDKKWAEKYNIPEFRSSATMNYQGIMTSYYGKMPTATTMSHEWGHHFDKIVEKISPESENPVLAFIAQTSYWAPQVSMSTAWLNASFQDKEASQKFKDGLPKDWEVKFLTSSGFKAGKDAVTKYAQMAHDVDPYGTSGASHKFSEDFAESVMLFLFDREHGAIGLTYTGEGARRGKVRFATLYPERAKILSALFDESDDWMGKGSKTDRLSGMQSKTNKFDKRFKAKYGHINPDGDGDCYEAAFNLAEKLSRQFESDDNVEVRLVHGIPLGTGGEAAGMRYGHAWVEVDRTAGEIARLNEALRRSEDATEKQRIESAIKLIRMMGDVTVYDYSNGERHEVPKVLYYAIGNIEESDIRKYSLDELRKFAADTNHYGPWN